MFDQNISMLVFEVFIVFLKDNLEPVVFHNFLWSVFNMNFIEKRVKKNYFGENGCVATLVSYFERNCFVILKTNLKGVKEIGKMTYYM